jgi:hypothetical protein
MHSMKKFRRPSPALMISLVALFVALGGVSYAAATIGSAQIKNNSVRGKDVRNGTLLSKDHKKNSLGGAAIKESALGTVPSASVAANAAAGSIGASEVGQTIVRTTVTQIADDGVTGATVACAAGERALSGGGRFVGLGGDDLSVFSSGPATTAPGEPTTGGGFDAWRSVGSNANGGDHAGNAAFTSYVVCLQQ